MKIMETSKENTLFGDYPKKEVISISGKQGSGKTSLFETIFIQTMKEKGHE